MIADRGVVVTASENARTPGVTLIYVTGDKLEMQNDNGAIGTLQSFEHPEKLRFTLDRVS
jgi:hypothetical protein